MFFKKRIFLPLMTIGLGVATILYGVFVQSLFVQDDYVEYYNSGVRHLGAHLESGDEEELSSAKESFRNAFLHSPTPSVAAAILYNGTIPALRGADWKEVESRSILEEVVAELRKAGRYDPTDKDVKINLSKAIILQELADKYSFKAKGDTIVPLPPHLQSGREEEEADVNKPKEKDAPAEESGSKTPPPDF